MTFKGGGELGKYGIQSAIIHAKPNLASLLSFPTILKSVHP